MFFAKVSSSLNVLQGFYLQSADHVTRVKIYDTLLHKTSTIVLTSIYIQISAITAFLNHQIVLLNRVHYTYFKLTKKMCLLKGSY